MFLEVCPNNQYFVTTLLPLMVFDEGNSGVLSTNSSMREKVRRDLGARRSPQA